MHDTAVVLWKPLHAEFSQKAAAGQQGKWPWRLTLNQMECPGPDRLLQSTEKPPPSPQQLRAAIQRKFSREQSGKQSKRPRMQGAFNTADRVGGY